MRSPSRACGSYWDGRQEPSVDAPVHLFFGAGSMLRDPDQEYIVKSFPMTIQARERRLPLRHVFPDAVPQVGPHRNRHPATMSKATARCPSSGKCGTCRTPTRRTAVGLFHATYRDSPNPERGKDVELLDTRKVEGGGDWCGHIVGTTYTFTKTGNLRTLEGDPRFYLDDSLIAARAGHRQRGVGRRRRLLGRPSA